MQSTEKVPEHQNANYLAMTRQRDDAQAALAAERDRADRAEARLADTWDEGIKYALFKGEAARLSHNPYRYEGTA